MEIATTAEETEVVVHIMYDGKMLSGRRFKFDTFIMAKTDTAEMAKQLTPNAVGVIYDTAIDALRESDDTATDISEEMGAIIKYGRSKQNGPVKFASIQHNVNYFGISFKDRQGSFDCIDESDLFHAVGDAAEHNEPLDIIVTIYPDITTRLLESVEADRERMEQEAKIQSVKEEVEAATQRMILEITAEKDAILTKFRSEIQAEVTAEMKRIRAELAAEIDRVRDEVAAEKETVLLRIKSEVQADIIAEVDRLRSEMVAEKEAVLLRVKSEGQADIIAEVDRLRSEMVAEKEATLLRVKSEGQADIIAEVGRVREQMAVEKEFAIRKIKSEARAEIAANVDQIRDEVAAEKEAVLRRNSSNVSTGITDDFGKEIPSSATTSISQLFRSITKTSSGAVSSVLRKSIPSPENVATGVSLPSSSSPTSIMSISTLLPTKRTSFRDESSPQSPQPSERNASVFFSNGSPLSMPFSNDYNPIPTTEADEKGNDECPQRGGPYNDSFAIESTALFPSFRGGFSPAMPTPSRTDCSPLPTMTDNEVVGTDELNDDGSSSTCVPTPESSKLRPVTSPLTMVTALNRIGSITSEYRHTSNRSPLPEEEVVFERLHIAGSAEEVSSDKKFDQASTIAPWKCRFEERGAIEEKVVGEDRINDTDERTDLNWKEAKMEPVSPIPSLKSLLRPNNSKSKLSTMLDDAASISTVDVSDDLAPDPKIFVMSSLQSSVGASIVLTDDLAPDPSVVSSTQPPATAVVLSDELAPD